MGYAVKCRSVQEILENPEIDDPFKVFYLRDTEGLLKMHFAVVEGIESDGFIIGDGYPVRISGTTDSGLELHIYSIFPISPNRVILLVELGAEGTPRNKSRLRECVLKQPKYDPETNTIRIRVKKLYPEEVNYINAEIVKNSNEGFAFRKQPIGLIS